MSTAHEAVESSLRCPKCGAENIGRQKHIVWDARLGTAFCSVCATGGPLEKFQPKGDS